MISWHWDTYHSNYSFVWEIHQWRIDSPHEGPVRWKAFLDVLLRIWDHWLIVRLWYFCGVSPDLPQLKTGYHCFMTTDFHILKEISIFFHYCLWWTESMWRCRDMATRSALSHWVRHPPMTNGFPSQRASGVENIALPWCHLENIKSLA